MPYSSNVSSPVFTVDLVFTLLSLYFSIPGRIYPMSDDIFAVSCEGEFLDFFHLFPQASSIIARRRRADIRCSAQWNQNCLLRGIHLPRIVVATSQCGVCFYSSRLDGGKRHCATVLFIYLLHPLRRQKWMVKASLSSVRSEEAWVYNRQNGEQIAQEKKRTKIKQHSDIPCVECVYSSYDIIIRLLPCNNQCSGK